MRMLVMLVLGIAIGAFGTVTALSALRQGTAPNKGAMALTGHHFAGLRRMGDGGRCDADAIATHLRQMRAVANDLESTFLPTGADDDLFRRHSGDYRTALDHALASPPAQCDALARAVREVGARCKACHRDFRG
jgi:cytochrome c556